MAINFNTEPYYDDFNEDKKFYRILYRPGYAVQARELTQMQTILQNQISKQGEHLFKEGAMVIPGQLSIDTKVGYIKLEDSYNNILASTVLPSLLGTIVTSSSGIQAQVINYSLSENSDPPTLFVRYKDSGTDNNTKTFADGEVISDLDGTYSVRATSTSSTGLGSIATIQRGIYYTKGHFVLCEDQNLILEKYSDTPTYRVGLTAKEQIITPEEDSSLFDNAQNSFNYAAPGAHRYYISLTLAKLAIDSTEDVDFIELSRINNGTKAKLVSSTAYSQLEKTLATRTYDESGNYSVKSFEIDIREFRDNNRGAYAASRVYLIGDVVTNAGYTYVARNTGTSVGSTPPTHTSGTAFDGAGNTGIQWQWTDEPYYNRGIYKDDLTSNLTTNQANEAKLAIGLEPGKAYVEGYEIEKISTEYVPVNKARDEVDVENAVVSSQVGNYVLINNINNLPPIEDYDTINLYDRVVTTDGTQPSGNLVGTARARNVEWHNGTKGTDAAVYKLFLFDIQMNGTYSFANDVKSFYYNRSSNAQLSFTADIEPITSRLIGSATASSTTVTGTGTSFETDLNVGDYVLLGTALRRVTAIGGQNSITVDSSVTVTGVTIDRVTTEIVEPEKSSLIFPLPHYAIDTITNTTYQITEVVTANAGSASGGSCTLSIPISSGDAAAVDGDSYLVVWNDGTSGGQVIDVAESDINPSGTNVEFTLSDVYAGDSFKVIVTAAKDSGDTVARKSKTLVSGATVTFTSQSAATQTILDLGKADGFRLTSVLMDTGTFASPAGTYTKDITDRYNFDDGQRAEYYDTAKLVLKNSYTPPSGRIQVTFDYFSHNTGDYFTADSYPANVDYKQIPYFKGTPLRDCYDFRPRINDAGTDFSGSGASYSNTPKRGVSIRSDYTYYLARRTKIAVDKLGNFFSIDGEPSLNPGDPLDPSMGMVLYKLELEPYTFGTGDTSIIVDKLDNRRYTMRDIGKLEKRIDNLEYYASLSLLEQQTESLDIIDNNGDTRFKNGFIVDGFAGHNTGDTASPDYFCSIDMEQQELRPFFSQQNVNMIEKNSNDGQRDSSNYKLYGDVVTLPLDSTTPHVELIKQDFASRLENINPFAVFTFLGDVKINPSSDEWFETTRRPDLVIDVEGNYTTLKNMAERAGVLGTVWNSWQNNWTGQSRSTGTQRYTAGDNWAHARALREGYTEISIAEMNNRFGGPDRNRPARQIVVETQATEIGQTRTGLRTSIATKIDRQVVGDKILSTAAIPYMRSRNILVQIKKLKPLTRFWPFFEGVDVQEYTTKSQKLVYTPTGANDAAKMATHNAFDIDSNVGGLTAETARRINDDSQVCLNKGDIIEGSASGATAVVVGKEYDSDAGAFSLKVINVKGTFQSNETLTGSVSAQTGTFTSITSVSQGDNLVTDEYGEVEFLFNIPNNDEVRFRCGTRELKLVDVNSADGEFTSRARANYYAAGTLETRQQTVHAVRNAEIVEEQVRDNQVIVQTSERVVSDTGWYDPLAQTFLIDSEGGAFLSKVDIFFATKDEKIPVTLEIREVVNGYPGKRVLPFSRVTKNATDVNISTATVLVDDVNTASYDTPTTFEFPSPVYVQNNTEYCFVLSSDSNNYKVWVSQVGDTVPGTSRTISEQPYLGSLFKSQNASTWTADQTQDIKFTIYRANFDTSVIGNIQFVNDVIPYDTLQSDPFETRDGTNKVRVWHDNHGMTGGDRVTMQYSGGNVNGITASLFNSTHQVSDVEHDSYVITLGTSPANDANSSGYAGGTGVRASRNIPYDALHPIVQVQTFPETTTTFSVETISGKSIDGGETAYQQDATATGIVVNENNYFLTPRLVASEINETNEIGGDKSLTLNVTMQTESDKISPIIDTHRTSMVAISNKVNSPTETGVNVATLDDNVIISNSANLSVPGSDYNTITSSDSATQDLLKTLTVGKYVNVTGATDGDGTAVVLAVASDGSEVTFGSSVGAMTGNITLTQRELFVDELAPESSSTYSKYVTRRVNLANPSNYLRVKFAGNIPDEAEVEVWFRTQPVGATTSLEDLSYTQMTYDADVTKAENFTNRFFDVSLSAENLASYDAVQVKVVLKSTNSSAIPRIKDLRIISCA